MQHQLAGPSTMEPEGDGLAEERRGYWRCVWRANK